MHLASPDQLEVLTNVDHFGGYHPDFIRLREKYYGSEEAKSLEIGSDLEGTRLFSIREEEKGIDFRCFTHPSSYYSPSLRNTEIWNPLSWKKLLKQVGKLGAWDVSRFNLLNLKQAEQLQEAARKMLIPCYVSKARFPVIFGKLTWEDYLKKRSSSFNRNQRRCLRLMQESGFQYTHSLKIEQILEVFKLRNAVKGEGDYSVTSQFAGFISELRESLKRDGLWYEVGIEKDGILAAFLLAFWDNQGGFYTFQTSYNPEYKSLRLGNLTFEKAIEDALKGDAKLISFLGDSDYFLNFTNQVYSFFMVDLFAKNPKGIFLYGRRIFLKKGAELKKKINSWKEQWLRSKKSESGSQKEAVPKSQAA